MSFDWEKWVKEGSKPEELPEDQRKALTDAWKPKEVDPSEELRKQLFGNLPEQPKPAADPAGLSESDVLAMIEKQQKRRAFESSLAAVRTDIGEDEFSKHFDSAKTFMTQGMSPTDAFRFVRQESLTAAAIEKARSEERAKAAVLARNSEQHGRGRGGVVLPSSEALTDNPWANDKDMYTKQRNDLLRLTSEEEVAWRRANPTFMDAEKHHGDIRGVVRR